MPTRGRSTGARARSREHLEAGAGRAGARARFRHHHPQRGRPILRWAAGCETLLGARLAGEFGVHRPARAGRRRSRRRCAARAGEARRADLVRRRQPDRRRQVGGVCAGHWAGPARSACGRTRAQSSCPSPTTCCRTWRSRRRCPRPSSRAWPASPPKPSTRRSACAARRSSRRAVLFDAELSLHTPLDAVAVDWHPRRRPRRGDPAGAGQPSVARHARARRAAPPARRACWRRTPIRRDLSARTESQLGAWFSFTLPGPAAAGLSHTLGKRIGSRHAIPHGVSSCLVLPHVMRYLAPRPAAAQARIAAALGVQTARCRSNWPPREPRMPSPT